MLRRILVVLFLLFCCSSAYGQSTSLNVTTVDTDSQAWFGGSYSISFNLAPSGGNPNGYRWNGQPFNVYQTFTGATNGSGAFTVSLPSNTAITPANSTWRITVCPGATASCYTLPTLTVTGSAQSISLTPPGIRINLQNPPPTVTPSAYQDLELVNGGLGQTYYNLSTTFIKYCQTQPCGWVPLSGGGSPSFPVTSLATSASIVLTTAPSTNYSYYTLLGPNATVSVTGTPSNGNVLRLDVQQPAGGGVSVTFPSNFFFPAGWSLNTTANVHNRMAWVYDNNGNWQPWQDFGTGGGGGGSSAPNYGVSFTNQTTVTIPASSSLATSKNMAVACYDNNSPANMIFPGNVQINPTNLTVTVNFSVAQSGYCVLVLGSGGGPGSGNVVGTIPLNSGQVVIGQGANNIATIGSNGNTNQVLHGGTTPSFGQVNLQSDVTNQLPFTALATALPACSVATFTPTPTYTFATTTQSQCFEMTLAANVTSLTIAGAPTNGSGLYLKFTQSSTGGYTVAFPSNFITPTGWSLKTAANAFNNMAWQFDGTFWWPITDWGGTGGGGGGGAIGANGCVQSANGGAFNCTAALFDTGTIFKVLEDFEGIGPNPSIDIRAYGAIAAPNNAAPAIAGITATGSGSAFTLSTSSAYLVNGTGINIYGAGPANTLGTASAPTVTWSGAAAQPGSGYVVNGPTGNSNSNSYKIVWQDAAGGLTAASSATTISNAGTLGAQNVTLTSCSKSVETVTCTTSATHGLVAGMYILISGTTDDADFGGDIIVATAPTTTTFTYTSAVNANVGGSTAATGGTVYWWNCNHVALGTPPSGAIRGYIYGRTTGSYALIGTTDLVNSGLSGDNAYMVFDDFGQTGPQAPYFVPSTAPASATNDNLITTIASGGGTTSITTAAAASNSVSGATILLDNTVPIQNACTATGSGGFVYIPVPSGSSTTMWVTNSYMTLGCNVSQAGAMWLGETVSLAGSWYGNLSPTSGANNVCPQFCIEPHVALNGIAANPIMLASNASAVRGVTFSLYGNGARGLSVQVPTSIPLFSMSDNSFWSQCGSCDSTNVPLSMWAEPSPGGAAGVRIEKTLFSKSGNITTGELMSPVAIFRNIGEVKIKGAMMNRAGFFVEPNQAGINFSLEQDYEVQQSETPLVGLYYCGGSVSGWVKLENTILDTTNHPLLANEGCNGGSVNTVYVSIDGSSTPSSTPLISGWPFAAVSLRNILQSNVGTNSNTLHQTQGLILDGVLATTPVAQALTNENQHHKIGASNTLFTGAPQPAAPTCSVATGTPSSPAGTWQFKYGAAYPPNNGVGSLSPYSSSCTSNGTNQQITITVPAAITGAVGYTIWVGFDSMLTCTSPTTTTLTYTWTSSACGPSAATLAGAGPVDIQGVNAAAYHNWTTGFQDYLTQASAPANPTQGYCRFYFDTSSGLMKGLNYTGGACGPSGSGSTNWNAITTPTGNFSLNSYSGSTNYQSAFLFTGAGTLNQIFGWSNATAATSSVGQSSPQLFLCGFAWHSGASVQSCWNWQYSVGNGTDPVNTLSLTHSGSDTGLQVTSVPGPFETGASGAGYGGGSSSPEGTAPPNTSPYFFGASAYDGCYASSSSHTPQCSFNGDGPFPPTRTIFKGTITLATSSIATQACQTITNGSVNSVTASGALTSDVVSFNTTADITSQTGFVPLTTGGLTVYPPFVPSGGGFINVRVCNPTASSITPGTVVLNVAIYR